MKNGRMQCKDIPDHLVEKSILDVKGWSIPGEGHWSTSILSGYWAPLRWYRFHELPGVSWSDAFSLFHNMRPSVPEKLFYVKLQSMDRRGLVHGCLKHPYPGCADRLHLTEQCYRIRQLDAYQAGTPIRPLHEMQQEPGAFKHEPCRWSW